jgi:16S rRNA (uracil1498-N3)-methyltransferase
MIRVRTTEPLSMESRLILDPDQSHHLSAVLRVRTGDPIMALTPEGGRWMCEVINANEPVELKVTGLDDGPDANPQGALEVALPLLKGGRTDDLVRQLTELGAASILIYTSQRSVARIEPAREEKKLSRWRIIAHEATRQCGRTDTPTVSVHQGLPPGGAHHVFLWEEAPLEPSAREAMSACATSGTLTVLVGPEGGLDPEEAQALQEDGWSQASLGARVLRAETAVVAATVLALVALDERGY